MELYASRGHIAGYEAVYQPICAVQTTDNKAQLTSSGGVPPWLNFDWSRGKTILLML
jgi:hypothetical protein